MSSSDSCAVRPVLTIRSGVGRSSQVCSLLSYINGCAYRSSCVLREQLEGGDTILIPHGNAVYDGLQQTGEGIEVMILDISRGRMVSNGYTDRQGPKVGTATKGGCSGSRRNTMID